MSKLNIPEGSRDVIWRMLFGGGTRRPESGDATPIVDVGGAEFANAEASAGASPTGGGERRGGIEEGRQPQPSRDGRRLAGVARRCEKPRRQISARRRRRPRRQPRIRGLGGVRPRRRARRDRGDSGGVARVRFGAAWMGVGEGFSGEYSRRRRAVDVVGGGGRREMASTRDGARGGIAIVGTTRGVRRGGGGPRARRARGRDRAPGGLRRVVVVVVAAYFSSFFSSDIIF